MAKDVIITPANGTVDFLDATGNTDGIIQLDDSGNLKITNPGGDLTIGDVTSDLYIGDGINSVDIIFEQNGAIRGLTGKTLTLGQSDSSIAVAAPVTSAQNITISKSLPKLILDSPNSGDSWSAQGAQISLGESGDGGSAALHMTYVGNGYGYLGMGTIPSTGIPPYSTIRFLYNANQIYINSTVGIGVATPNAKLHVVNSDSGTIPVAAFYQYSGAAASPSEVADWPYPVLSLRSYGNYYRQTMLSFGLPNDADYKTDESVWCFRLNGVTATGWDNNGNTTPSTASSANVGLELLGPGNLRLGTVNSKNIYFRTNNSDRATVDGSGNVGIGTLSPTSTLHVVGNANVTGNLTATNKCTKEFVIANTATNGANSVDLLTSNYFRHVLTANSTFTFRNAPASGTGQLFSLLVIQDATGGRTVSWGNTIYWAGGSAPPATTNANARDLWTFITYDAGATYWGSLTIKDAR